MDNLMQAIEQGNIANAKAQAIELDRLRAANADLVAAAQIGLACCIAWGGKCEAKGENILALQSVMHAESIRAAIAKAKVE